MKKLLCFVLLACCLSTPADAQRIKRTRKTLLRPANIYSARSFPALKWRVTLGLSRDTAPAIADLDLDGAQEILIPGVNVEFGNHLYCLTDNGDVKWRAALPSAATSGVTLGDIDRDGTLDILLATGSTLLCFDTLGKERWRYTVRIVEDSPAPPEKSVGEPIEDLTGSTLPDEIANTPAPEERTMPNVEVGAGALAEIHSQPTIADIDNDGISEIIFGANDNRLYVLNASGRVKWSYKTKSWIVGGVALGNLTGDGKLEIVFGSMDYNLYCLDSSGRELWKYAAYDWIQSSPVIADVDKDGGQDIVFSADDGWLYCLSRRGTLKWKEQLVQKQRLKPYLAVADLDGEGTLETIAALPDGTIQVFTAFGDRAWQRNVYSGVLASPLVADLDGDNWQDILVVTADGSIVALNTWGEEKWRHALGQTIEATPAIADLDRDGKWEIYVANLMSQTRDAGFFSQFELSTNGGKATWPAMKGDLYRTASSLNGRDYGSHLKRGGDYATAWEPFFAGTRPRSKLLPPRRLKVTALPLEDVRGNRDGALDPGETALFKVRVQNLGKGASYDTSLAVDLGNSPLKLDRPKTFLGWLAPGASKTVTFRLTAPPLKELLKLLQEEQTVTFRDVAAITGSTLPAGAPSAKSTIKLPIKKSRRPPSGWQSAKLRVTESGSVAALAESKIFNVPPLPPHLKIARLQVVDKVTSLTFGNANTRLDSGETVVLTVLLRNEGLSSAKMASAILTSPSGDVLVASPLASFKDVVPYGGRQVNFSLRVARKIQNNNVKLKLKTEVDSGRGGTTTRTEEISLPLRQLPLDTTAPAFTLRSPKTRVASTSRATMILSGIVSDASDIASFKFAQETIAIKSLKKLGPNRYQFIVNRALKVGENVFALNATDNAGNSSTLWLRIVRKPK